MMFPPELLLGTFWGVDDTIAMVVEVDPVKPTAVLLYVSGPMKGASTELWYFRAKGFKMVDFGGTGLKRLA